jgi:enoyl-CoA hydratase/carnithine racemase
LTRLAAPSYTASLVTTARPADGPGRRARASRATDPRLLRRHTATGRIAMEVTQSKLVTTSVKNGVMTLELTFDPGNCYTHEMMRALDEAILQARFDNNVHVVVIRGAGEKFFCAGADINMLKKADPTFKYYFCLHANETLNRLEQTPKLVIAALNGHTVGGGLEIAMAADIRIARKGAGKVGLPEVTLGVLPGTGGTQRLARLVNKSKAIELMVTGDVFGFEQALELGIVNQIWETANNAEFMEKIQTYAEQFCPPNKASKAVGRIKRSVQTGAEIPFETALAVERELQQFLFQSEDAKEGLAAYIEKRKPGFQAR